MNVIAATRRNGRYDIFETDYLHFVLRLADRIGSEEAKERGGLPTVDVETADDYVAWLRQYSIDPDELTSDFQSLTSEERSSSLPEFLPTVLVDFDSRTFYCAHPEAHYLNYGSYLPKGWTYSSVADVTALLPEEHTYWRAWRV